MDLSAALARATLDEITRPSIYDVIVIGAGAAGGLAAALLAENGLRVLVLDAGWRPAFWRAPLRRTISTGLETLADPRAMRIMPPVLVRKSRRLLRLFGYVRQPVQSTCYAWPTAPESFVDDVEQPYETPPGLPFEWIRAQGLGGRMAIPAHGRQYLRQGAEDFAPADDLSPAWPFSPGELDRWYDLVEDRLGLSGRQEHCPWVPDSRLAEVREPLSSEIGLIDKLQDRFPGAMALLGRYAEPMRALDAAAATGNLSCRQGAIVRHVEVDPRGRTEGVVFYDRRSASLQRARAPLVFLCASTIESARILLTSRSDAHPDGLGGASGALGCNLIDHVSLKLEGTGPDLGPDPVDASTSRCVYVPRLDLSRKGDTAGGRGFGVRIYQSSAPRGASHFVAVSDSGMLPRAENRVILSGKKDAWGLPTLRIICSRNAMEMAVAREQADALQEIGDLVGVRPSQPIGGPSAPGSSIHECGTARMGADPGDSVLNPYNECWDAKGLYVTDGASFPSLGIQNPTLTIMALTARACDQAIGGR